MTSADPGVRRPSWMVVCAWAAFLSVVPSALWRLLMIAGLLPGAAALRAFELGTNPAAGHAYVIALSVLQIGFAWLTVGLVRPWGEKLYRWRVPRLLPVGLGVAGGLAVTWIFNISMVSAIAQGQRPDAGLMHGWPLVVMVWCYLPILLWGPLVLATTWGYWRTTSRDHRLADESRSR